MDESSGERLRAAVVGGRGQGARDVPVLRTSVRARLAALSVVIPVSAVEPLPDIDAHPPDPPVDQVMSWSTVPKEGKRALPRKVLHWHRLPRMQTKATGEATAFDIADEELTRRR